MVVSRSRLRWLAVAGVVLGCHRSAPTPVEPAAPVRDDDDWSRIVVHAPVEAPVEVRTTPAIALTRGYPNPDTLPVPDYQPATVPIETRCRRNTMCLFVVRGQMGAPVFAFDPVVEVELSPAATTHEAAVVRYHDAASTSAALGHVYALSVALERACFDTRLERAERIEAGRPHERDLSRVVRTDERGIVRRAAALALVQGQCSDAGENRAIARELLGELDATAPELSLWTDALRFLGPLAEDPVRATALIDTVIETHPRPGVGARLLAGRLAGLGDGDARRREALLQRLRAPRFARTVSAKMALSKGRPRNAIRPAPGEQLPTLALAGLDDAPIRASPDDARRVLVYFSASWCGGCVDALPKVRQFAAAHPEVRIVYVLWEGPNDARAFQARVSLPGEVAWTDTPAREEVRAQIFRYVSLPSFVLADERGRILATSDETKFSALDALLADDDDPAPE